MNNYFLDTSFSIALALSKDEFHTKAIQLSNRITEEKAKVVTTTAILFEIGNSLSKKRFRRHAVEAIDRLSSESNIAIVAATDELFDSALDLFRNRMDKNWSLVGCMSFVVM